MSEDTQPLVKIREWADEPEEGMSADEWPYPTTHILSEARGELAERITRAIGCEYGDRRVLVTQHCVSTGWSEWTQEEDYDLTIEVEGYMPYGVQLGWRDGLRGLLVWLDSEAPLRSAQEVTPDAAPRLPGDRS